MDEATAVEALIPRFKIGKVLNQDQGGRRITLLGSIDDSQALFTAERAAFPTNVETLEAFHASLTNIENLGANDIYHWYLASYFPTETPVPDLKINLIYPCTEQHVKKYSPQGVRMVTETPEIYKAYVRPFIQKKRDEGRLNWIYNIIEGRTEQEDVLFRDASQEDQPDDHFIILPDLNWDRKTLSSLHLLGLVERRDIWSLRDLKKSHVPWLQRMRGKILDAAVKLYPELDKDMLKLYIHYQPTYYHFHIHIVNVMLESGGTQATGKAFGLENIISQLETMSGGSDASLADVSLTYSLGEASDLWTEIFISLKQRTKP